MHGIHFNLWSHHNNSPSLYSPDKKSTITMKETNHESSHNNKRHFHFFCISFSSSLKYSDANRHYLQHNPHTPLRCVKRGAMRSMRPAA